MKTGILLPLLLSVSFVAAPWNASSAEVSADILDTRSLRSDSFRTETESRLVVECDAAVAGSLAVVGDVFFSNGIARVAPGGGLDATNPDIRWSDVSPVWWLDFGVLNGSPANDDAAATAGQLKWLADRARVMLDNVAWSVGGAGESVSNLVSELPPTSNSLAVTAADLKRVARPFSLRCVQLQADCAFSEAEAVEAALAPGPRDGEIVTVGQIKNLFAFDLSVDTDGNSIPDWWERFHGVFDPDSPGGAPDPCRDSDDDGLPDVREYVLGTNPSAIDTDSDGLPDADETEGGTDPRNPDTDGDGLPDGLERGSVFVSGSGDIVWVDPDSCTNRIDLFSDTDDESFLLRLPFPFIRGSSQMTNLLVNANGLVSFSNDGGIAYESRIYNVRGASALPLFEEPCVTIGAFWSDLRIWPEMSSAVSFATAGTAPERTAVLDFHHAGFHSGGTNDFVSFQLQFFESVPGLVRVVFGEASGLGTGAAASLGARTVDCVFDVFYKEPGSVRAGLCIDYRFGFETDPLDPDTDADGLSDAEEIGMETDPLSADTDGDGLVDRQELFLGTDPRSRDTDGDFLSDGWELSNGLDPLDPSDGLSDDDGDGISFWQEILEFGTDPSNSDTDRDGIGDGVETQIGSNPARNDTDGDGLDDGDETVLGTDPLSADTDGDGCSDGWEILHGFDPLSGNLPVLTDDPDGDGLSNAEEARHGTDPFSPDSDGDGLPDSREAAWVEISTARMFDMSAATNLLDGVESFYRDSAVLRLPFPVLIHGRQCTSAILGVRGILTLLDRDDLGPMAPVRYIPRDLGSKIVDEAAVLFLAAFWDYLLFDEDEYGLGSRWLVSEPVENGIRHFVIEYRNFGFTSTTQPADQRISFQIAFSENEPDTVLVSFLSAGPEPSGADATDDARRFGSEAVLGFQTWKKVLQHSFKTPVAMPGTQIVYHLGTGTDPLDADTDADGLSDGSELAGGTDPLSADTDGDALLDGEEVAAGRNPLVPNAGDDAPDADPDGDGLSNAREADLGTDWDDPDTDGDGVSDSAEWIQGSDPRDPTDSGPNDQVEMSLRFGDWSGSRSETYEVCVKPVAGDPRPPLRFVNRYFGELDTVSFSLRPGGVYELSLRHVQSSLLEEDLDYELEISPAPASSGWTPILVDPDELCGRHSDVYCSQFEKRVLLAVARAALLPDRNRDGAIDGADIGSGPLRMWINDDKDDGAIAKDDSDVPTGGTDSVLDFSGANFKDYRVNGMSDLEDFFPVWLDASEALAVIRSLVPTGRIAVRFRGVDADVGAVWTELPRQQAGACLRDVPTAMSYSDSLVTPIDRWDGFLPGNKTAQLASHPDSGVFLLEGRGAGFNGSLRADILVNGSSVCHVAMPVLIAPVEQFYRWVNLRGTVGGSENRSTDLSEPVAFPDSETNGKNVVFVHGFSVTEEAARGWNAEVFKRLWQNGSRARYYAVTWKGDLFVGKAKALFYHEDVVNAFLTAGDFNTVFADMASDTAVLAHSLGNMVVCSAIQDLGFRPAVYCMLNAAVPAEAIDTNAWSDAEIANPMVHHDWKGYANRTWAAKWHELFPENDSRRKLTWKGRFETLSHIPGLSLYNFYSSGDEVLGLHQLVEESGMVMLVANTGGEFRTHSWQKQERFKGRKHFRVLEQFASTDQAGWGFKCHKEFVHANSWEWERDTYLDSDAANSATLSQLRETPVFENNPPVLFSGTMPRLVRDALLARAIPALSAPIGAIGSPTAFSSDNEIDCNDFSERGSPATYWPRPTGYMYGPDFLHSDIKNIALPLIPSIWRMLTSCANE